MSQFYAIFITVLSSFCILVVGMYLRQVFSIEIGQLFRSLNHQLRLLLSDVIYLTYGSFDLSFLWGCLLKRSFSELCFRLYFFHPGNQSEKMRLSFYIVTVNPSVTRILLFYNAHMLTKFQLLFYLYPSCFVKIEYNSRKIIAQYHENNM